MFRGLGAVNFNYSGGIVSGSNGWSYDIRVRFDSQMAAQPQYKSLTDGYKHLANMAIGLADDNYRAAYGVMPGTNLSEFGQWIDSNRQAIYSDAQGWFTYVPPESGGGGGSTTPGGGGSTLACTMVGKKPLVGSVCCSGLALDSQGICNTSAGNGGGIEDFFGFPKEYLIYGGLAILALMMMKR